MFDSGDCMFSLAEDFSLVRLGGMSHHVFQVISTGHIWIC